MERRRFVGAALAAAAGAALPAALPRALPAAGRRPGGGRAPAPAPAFTLKFAPHFGMFTAHAGEDPIAELRFMHEQGFRAIEDNLMRKRPLEMQERIGREAKSLGMEVGLISALQRPNTPPGYVRPQLASGKPTDREEFLRDVRDTVPVAQRVGARFLLVTPGQLELGVEPSYQMANAVDNLRALAKVVQPHGLTLLLEPLNPWANHAGAFVTKSSQLFQLVRAVDSPAFKMLFDIYHLQISEGNLIGNLDRCWSEIGYIQTGDVPGRNEPGTGEINYARVFEHLHNKGWRGVIGTEHNISRPGKDGEQAFIDAYRKVDPRPGGARS
jgi:hydroxypyruvate isomerase